MHFHYLSVGHDILTGLSLFPSSFGLCILWARSQPCFCRFYERFLQLKEPSAVGISTNYCNTSIWLWGLQPQSTRCLHIFYTFVACVDLFGIRFCSPFCLSVCQRQTNRKPFRLCVISDHSGQVREIRSLLNFRVPPKSVNLCLGLFTLTIALQYLISGLAFRQSLFFFFFLKPTVGHDFVDGFEWIEVVVKMQVLCILFMSLSANCSNKNGTLCIYLPKEIISSI